MSCLADAVAHDVSRRGAEARLVLCKFLYCADSRQRRATLGGGTGDTRANRAWHAPLSLEVTFVSLSVTIQGDQDLWLCRNKVTRACGCTATW